MKSNILVLLFIILLLLLSSCGTTYNFDSNISGTLTKSDNYNSSSGYYSKSYYINALPGTSYRIILTSNNTAVGVSVFDSGVEHQPKNAPANYTYLAGITSSAVHANVWIYNTALTSAGNSVNFTLKIQKQ
jgi:hypothetical protein